MIQSKAGIVGDEIDFDALPARHVDRVLENSCSRFSADPGQLKGMPVKVDRMIVAAAILHRDSVTRPSFTISGSTSGQDFPLIV